MKKSPSHMLLTLAASDVSIVEIHDFFQWVVSRGASRATDTIHKLRRAAEQPERYSIGRSFAQNSISPKRSERLSIIESARRADAILREAGLGKERVVEQVARE